MVGGLIIRRFWKIYSAKRVWSRIISQYAINNLPESYFRIAISGVNSGLGRSCLELVSDFPSIHVTCLSRDQSIPNGILVELTDDASVRRCVNTLTERWYNLTLAPNVGQDIVINNAGIFGSTRSSHVWEANTVAPAFITEELSKTFAETGKTGRTLRFVQVGSRLESGSDINASNLRHYAFGALGDSDPALISSAYADSKRALMLHTRYMCETYKSVKTLSYIVVTPGMVNTNLGKRMVHPVLWWISAPLRFLFMKHPIEGAVSIISAAFGYPGETGLYTAQPGEILERLTVTRDPEAGRIVSEIVKEHFNIV
jgi:NAD(P)-dependent dehydrogenase (short-subunit alcohol dehydrogenase family)